MGRPKGTQKFKATNYCVTLFCNGEVEEELLFPIHKTDIDVLKEMFKNNDCCISQVRKYVINGKVKIYDVKPLMESTWWNDGDGNWYI